jgi:hypothetical protein
MRARSRAIGRGLTVAVPLHRSAAWVSSIGENLAALPRGTRVLLSDVTREDDALLQLRRRFRGNRHVRVLRAPPPDSPGWRAHWNHLLAQADTELFAWLPHDDRITAGYYERLIEALSARPTAVLAYGPVVTIGGQFERPQGHFGRPFAAGTDRPEYEAVQLAREWNLGIPIHGVFRAASVRPIPPMPGDRFADVVWAFGVALSGHLIEVDDAIYVKRFHDATTHTEWEPITTEEYVDALARQIRAGSPVRELAPDTEARLHAGFAGAPSHFPPWLAAP